MPVRLTHSDHLRADGLSVAFGDRRVFADLGFAVTPGQRLGLIGENGAGKSTTIKMLITLLIPTSGQARVLGRDVVEDAHWVRERIGYVFGGDRGLYERLSALDNLRYFAELYGVDPKRQRARIGELLDQAR